MIQLCFPFANDMRNLPPREISSVGLEKIVYDETKNKQLTLVFNLRRRPRVDCRRHKKRLYKGQSTLPCCYCGAPLSYKDGTVEHIIPLSKGGTNRRENVTIACAPCNNHRQDYSFDEWKKIVNSPAKDRSRRGAVKIFCNSYMAFYDYLKSHGRLMERKYLR